MTALLAIDTSTSACSVALNIDGEITEDFVVAPQDHTQRLLPMVENLLNKTNTTLKELDAIAFSSGPGSFTGLRICLGVVQGLAYGADIPVIGVSTLEIISATALRTLEDVFERRGSSGKPIETSDIVIIPALDARMSEVYWSIFHSPSSENSNSISKTLIRVAKDKVSSPSDVCLPSDMVINQPIIIGVGDGWGTEGINRNIAEHIEPELLPHAFDLACLAEKYLLEGKTMSAFDAQPTYIRNEVSWAKRKKIRSSLD